MLATIAKPEYNNVINQNAAGSTYAWSASTGVLDANFADTIGTTDSIQIFTQGYQFAWKPDTVNVIDDTDVMTLLENVNPNATAQVWNNKLTYVGTTASTSDEFVVDGNQLKHSVRMVAPPRLPSGFTGTPKYLAIGGDIGTTAQDWASIDLWADGTTHLTDFVTSDDLKFCLKSDGTEIYRIPKITVTDDAGNEVNGQYKLVFGANNVVTLYMLCPWDWLQQAQYPILIDPTVIVSSAYDTSGNGGRKIVRLSNNWIVTIVHNSPNWIYYYVSKDNGQTWAQLYNFQVETLTTDYVTGFAIASSGTTIYTIVGDNYPDRVYSYAFDATTVVQGNSYYAGTIDTAQSVIGAVSLSIDGIGALHAAWCSKNSTYPNSFNIRYSKGTVSGTTVTWATPTQITSINTSGAYSQDPCIVVQSNNNPIIYADFYQSGVGYQITAHAWNGSSWLGYTPYFGSASPAQSKPIGMIDKNNTLHAFWMNGTASIYHSSSSDGGSNWSTPDTPYSGTSISSFTVGYDSNAQQFYVFVCDNGTIYQVKGTPNSWGSAVSVATGTNPQALWSEFNANSSDAIRYIYMANSQVDYVSIPLDQPPNAPVLNPVTNFDATKSTTFSWTFSDPDPGDSQSAFQLQVLDVAAGTNAVDTGKTASTSTSYTVAANTLSNAKQYQWRVTTWDSQGQQGPYSAYNTFNTAGAPTTTVTSPANNASVTTSSITAQWSYSDPGNYAQQSFQVQLLASDDLTVLADSSTVNSTGNQYTISYTLANNTTYFVSVRTTNSQGVTSAWASSTFSTSFTLPQQPSVTASALSTSAKITIAMTNYASKNLVLNSGFEVVTTTATVFSDALTSYTGSTVPAPWTLQSGSFTFGASGATIGANGSLMTAGNAHWKPVLGSDGTTKLAIKGQKTITTPSTLSSGNNGRLTLFQDNNNSYWVELVGSGALYISKKVSGSGADITSVGFTVSASTTYTMTLSLDNTGLLTAKLYQGTNTSGTLLQTLTATDTSLTGGFLIGVGGDTGVVISNASVTAPWANSWTIGGDSRVAWGLTQSAIGGKYSVSAVGVGNSVYGNASQTITTNASTTYTASVYMNTNSEGSVYGANAGLQWSNGTENDFTSISGTTNTQRYSETVTSPSGTTSVKFMLVTSSAGTVTFDNIQLEQGSSATPYIENDSTSAPQSAPNVSYNDVYRRNSGTTAWTRIATQVNPSGTYDDYAVASGQAYDYKVTAIGNNGTQVDSAVTSTSVSFTGDWVYNPTSGQQFQFLFNRKAYAMAISEERKEVQTFSTKPMVRRGPLNARTGTLDALMVKVGTSQTPIQQLQAFEADLAAHNAYYLKTAAGEVLKVDLYKETRSMPAENLNAQAIGVSVNWTEVA